MSPVVGQPVNVLPTITVQYSADASIGLDLTKLSVMVNDANWTSKFSQGVTSASYTVVQSDRLVAGSGKLRIVATVADNAGTTSTPDSKAYDLIPILRALDKTAGFPGDTVQISSAAGLDPTFSNNFLRFQAQGGGVVDAPFTAVSADGATGAVIIPDTAASGAVSLVVNGMVSSETLPFVIAALRDCGPPKKILPFDDNSFLVWNQAPSPCAWWTTRDSLLFREDLKGNKYLSDDVDPLFFDLLDVAMEKTGTYYALVGSTDPASITIRYLGKDTIVDLTPLATTLTASSGGATNSGGTGGPGGTCVGDYAKTLLPIKWPATDFDSQGNFYFTIATWKCRSPLGADWDKLQVYRVSHASLEAGGRAPIELVAADVASVTPLSVGFYGYAVDLRIDCNDVGHLAIANPGAGGGTMASIPLNGPGTSGKLDIPIPFSMSLPVTPGQVWVSGVPSVLQFTPEIWSSTGGVVASGSGGFMTLTQDGSVLWYQGGAGFTRVPIPQNLRVTPQDNGAGVVTALACPCGPSKNTLVIAPSPSTTRYKAQKDTTTPMVVTFTGPKGLTAGTLAISNLSGTAVTLNPVPTLTVVDGTSDPSTYSLTWAGPWLTNPSDATSYLPSGDYKIMITATGGGRSVHSLANDPHATVSLVEVTSVELCQADGLEDGCSPLQTPYQGVSADNLGVPKVGGQDASQGRPGGGMRIFAEATTPGGTVLNQVKVRATISPRLPLGDGNDVTVYFQSYDVADPVGSSVSPVTNGQDNRGKPLQGTLAHAHKTVSAGTTTASTTFKTSTYPGDNYRIAASTSNTWVGALAAVRPSQTGDVQDSNQQKVSAGLLSPMLTVWRTLHVEVNAMAAPPPVNSKDPHYSARNFIVGNVTGLSNLAVMGPQSKKPTRLTLLPEVTNPRLVLDDGSRNLDGTGTTFGFGRFENGTIRVGSDPGSVTITPLDGNGTDYVRRSTGISIPYALYLPGQTPTPSPTPTPLPPPTATPIPAVDNSTSPSPRMFAVVRNIFHNVFASMNRPRTAASRTFGLLAQSGPPTAPTPFGGVLLGWDAAGKTFDLDKSVGPNNTNFDGGSIVVAGVTWTIIRARGHHVEVDGDQALPFNLVDDDKATPPFGFRAGLLTASDNPAVNPLAQAYVRPSYDLASPKTPPFLRNVSIPVTLNSDGTTTEDDNLLINQLCVGRTNLSSADFWVVYLQGAFQGDELLDRDPDNEDKSTLGKTMYWTTDNGFVGALGSLIYLETTQDSRRAAMTSDTNAYQQCLDQVVTHEVGHQFGLGHNEDADIMSSGTLGCVTLWFFSPSDLGAIRSVVAPGPVLRLIKAVCTSTP
jgi:hypothetical protein